MNNTLNHAWLLTGGNLGDRIKNLGLARSYIDQDCGTIVKASAVYETSPWGKTDQPVFFNQALEIQTALSPRMLMRAVLKIEKKMGRTRNEKYGARLIDIDILLFNDEIIHTPSLVLPHPELPNRRFALVPLAEIAATRLHPVLKKTISQLLEKCTDNGSVQKIPEGSSGN